MCHYNASLPAICEMQLDSPLDNQSETTAKSIQCEFAATIEVRRILTLHDLPSGVLRIVTSGKIIRSYEEG